MKKVTIFAWLICLAVILGGVTSFAGTTKVEIQIIPELKAYRINPHPPAIDGKLDDSLWSNSIIEKGRLEVQRDPDEGMPATESTLVAVGYDDKALYLAFWCYDSEPDKIDGQLVRRDRIGSSDRVTVRVDPFHDHQNGVAFQVSAAGVQVDTRYYNEYGEDMSWDAVWESGVSEQPWGWSAEMRIPYYCFRFPEKAEHTWGIDFVRHINRKNEIDGWAFTPMSKGGFVSNFGHLNNIRGISPAGHLELLPYAVSKEETEPKSIGNPDGRLFSGNTGLDIKYGISSHLVLDAAINPDFGQVELDAPVLNLSAYETFFEEKRPFFMEGADLFATNYQLFYSRRIGRQPVADVDDPDLLYYRDYPRGNTILGAAKLTGKIFKRTSIALLSAMTQREEAEYAAGANYVFDSTHTNIISMDTVFREGVVEPEANYSVLRVKQEVFKNSSIGGMLTLAGQKGFSPATTGGVDWRLLTNDGKWETSGQVVFSRINHAQTGYAAQFALEKAAGKHFVGAMGLYNKDRNLNINRLGYMERADQRGVWGWLQHRNTDDWWITKEMYNNFNIWSEWNFDGANISLGGNYNFYFVFKNYWDLSGSAAIQAEKYSDVETRGRGLWVWAAYPTASYTLSLESDGRKKLSAHWSAVVATDRGGTWWNYHNCVSFRPRSNMEFDAGATFAQYLDGTYWVKNTADSSIFADLDRDHLTLSASASIVVNRNLSMQLSAQGLVSGLDYSRYRYYLGGNNYSAPFGGLNCDYNYSALNSTFLIRWEYRPGSTIYLVWTRALSDFDPTLNNLDLHRDLDRLFSSGAQNLFLIKASYWMNI